MFQTKVVEKMKTHILCLITFSKIMLFMTSCGKCCRAGRAADDSMALVHCMLNDRGYKHTLRMYNNSLFHGNNGCTNVP